MIKNICFFCGGRGATTILKALIKQTEFRVSTLINAYDDGKSTGIIRELFHMLGPSDVRKLQMTMADYSIPEICNVVKLFEIRINTQKELNEILDNIDEYLSYFNLSIYQQKKISETLSVFNSYTHKALVNVNIEDFSLGNCIYAGAYLQSGQDFKKMIDFVKPILQCKGDVVNISDDTFYLVGIDQDGNIYNSECSIDTAFYSNFHKIYTLESPLSNINLAELEYMSFDSKVSYLSSIDRNARISRCARNILCESDIIIYSPGTLSTSLLPTYKVSDVSREIFSNQAIKIFVCNLAPEYKYNWVTPTMQIRDTLRYLNAREEDYINYISYVLVDSSICNDYIDEIKYNFPGITLIRAELQLDNGTHNGDLVYSIIKKITMTK